MINDQPFYYSQTGDTIVSRIDSVIKTDSIIKTTIKADSLIGADSTTLINDSILPVIKTNSHVAEEVTEKVTEKVTDTTAITEKKDSKTTVKNNQEDSANIFLKETVSLPAPVRRKNTSPLQEYNDWLSVFLIVSVIIIGFLRISSMKFLRELFNSAFYSQAATKMYSSVNIRNSKPSLILSILFFVNTGLFIFEALVFYQETIFDQKGFSLLLIVWVILIGYDVIKGFLYRMTGFVFDTSLLTGEYLFNSAMLSKVYAIILLPVISFIPFVNLWMVPNLIKIGVAMFIILYIWQLIRGVKIFFHNTFSVFYMFLYFCALEILPLVILFKILFN